MAKILKLNPWIQNPHKIFPGQTLTLETPVDRLPAQVTEAKKEEILEPPQALTISKLWERYFETSSIMGFSGLHSKDKSNGGSATLASGINVGAQGRYARIFSRYEVGMHLSLVQKDFQKPDARVLENKSGIYGKFGPTFKMELGHTYRFSSSLSALQIPILRGLTTQRLIIDRHMVGEAEFGVQALTFYRKGFSLLTEIEGSVLIPRDGPNYSMDLSYGYAAGVRMRDQLKLTQELELGIFYSSQIIQTSISDQSNWDLSMRVSYLWNF